MRTTVLERIECRRLVPFDPDEHGMLDRIGSVELKFESVEDKSLRVRIRFKNEIRSQKDGTLWGVIEGEGYTIIAAKEVKREAFESKGGKEIPTNVLKLIEGAFMDEILLPVSQVARSMHLPGLLISPLDVEKLLRRDPDDGARSTPPLTSSSKGG